MSLFHNLVRTVRVQVIRRFHQINQNRGLRLGDRLPGGFAE
jgi:hypothetical protein